MMHHKEINKGFIFEQSQINLLYEKDGPDNPTGLKDTV